MTKSKIYMTAGEASGDVFGREVMEMLFTRTPNIEFRSVGGAEMAHYGSTPDIDISPLNILGYWEGIKAYPQVARLTTEVANDILTFDPKLAVLIDAWGFSLRIAKKVRAQNPSIKLIKLIGPQVWASRPGRAKTVAEHFDRLLCSG